MLVKVFFTVLRIDGQITNFFLIFQDLAHKELGDLPRDELPLQKCISKATKATLEMVGGFTTGGGGNALC